MSCASLCLCVCLFAELAGSVLSLSTCQSGFDLDDFKSKRIEAVRGQILSKLKISRPPEVLVPPGDPPPEVILLYNSTRELLKERARQAESACERESSEEDYYAKEVQKIDMQPPSLDSAYQRGGTDRGSECYYCCGRNLGLKISVHCPCCTFIPSSDSILPNRSEELESRFAGIDDDLIKQFEKTVKGGRSDYSSKTPHLILTLLPAHRMESSQKTTRRKRAARETPTCSRRQLPVRLDLETLKETFPLEVFLSVFSVNSMANVSTRSLSQRLQCKFNGKRIDDDLIKQFEKTVKGGRSDYSSKTPHLILTLLPAHRMESSQKTTRRKRAARETPTCSR
ncbi:UNVERIFIED_CONTAM: hypothetical protein FKN15_016056 [Acipenser sinensis]